MGQCPSPLSGVGMPSCGDSVSDGVEDEDDPAEDEPSALGLPKVGLVIRDQLRQVAFEPFRLWCPPLDAPLPIDTVVAMRRGKPWTQDYGVSADLVFPVGIIDRPFKQDQQPLLVEAAGSGASVLVLGGQGSGKTTMLQTLVCSAALTHSPGGAVLCSGAGVTGAGIAGGASACGLGGLRPRRGRHPGHHGPADGAAGVAAAQLPGCGVNSIEQFRRRKFGGEPGAVPEDPYGDVFLVVDDFKALTDDTSTIRGRERRRPDQHADSAGPQFRHSRDGQCGQGQQLAPHGPQQFPAAHRAAVGQADSDATNVKAREAAKVPVGRPGRGWSLQGAMPVRALIRSACTS